MTQTHRCKPLVCDCLRVCSRREAWVEIVSVCGGAAAALDLHVDRVLEPELLRQRPSLAALLGDAEQRVQRLRVRDLASGRCAGGSGAIRGLDSEQIEGACICSLRHCPHRTANRRALGGASGYYPVGLACGLRNGKASVTTRGLGGSFARRDTAVLCATAHRYP